VKFESPEAIVGGDIHLLASSTTWSGVVNSRMIVVNSRRHHREPWSQWRGWSYILTDSRGEGVPNARVLQRGGCGELQGIVLQKIARRVL